jgi:hypothetical protein
MGQRNNSFSSAAIASRTRKMSGGVKTPRLTQFHGIVTSPPMLQLGDKGARQGKKILVKPISRSARRPSLSSDGHFANPIRPEA